MNQRYPAIAAIVVVFLATALVACGIGPGKAGSGTVVLTVTRDYGGKQLLTGAEQKIPSGETAMRFLQRRAKIETRYGGRFVSAIDDLHSSSGNDWFYYVNGIEAETGAADRKVAAGDRIWWDYHDWSAVMRVPAVVGSFPEPFIHGSEGKRFPVRVDCAQHAEGACTQLVDRLDEAGIPASTTAIGVPAGDQVLRFVVGRWEEVRRDEAAHQIEKGPDVSGVFARFRPVAGSYELDLLDARERIASRAGPGTGLVAATRFENQQPAWVVTGVDDLGLQRAIRLVSARALRNRFAVVATATGTTALPVTGGGEKK